MRGAMPLVPPQVNEDFRHDHRLGRRGAAAARARQRRHARRRRQGARAGRRGHRPLPHRAHVLRRRAPADRAAHDPGRRRGAAAGRAGRAAAVPAERLRGDLRGDGRPAGDDPAARPAAARVPARPRRPGGRDRPAARRRRRRRRGGPPGAGQGPRRGAARAEPDARHPRLPAGAAVSRDLRDAGARHRPRRARRCEGAKVEIMHPLVGLRRGAAAAARDDRGGDRGRGRRHRRHGRAR